VPRAVQAKHIWPGERMQELFKRADRRVVAPEWLTMLNPIRERDTIMDWVRPLPTALDLAFSLHVPASLRWQEQGWDEQWLSKRLKHFFTDLDRKALGAANRRKHLHLDRLVVLHQSPNVGWHAHCQITTPQCLSQDQLALLAERLWLRSLGPHARGKFQQRLFWCEPVVAGHMPYMLGHLSKDTVDWENTLLTCAVA
jgi:hypothetical protein